jgi:hypothetical protein
MPVQAQAPGSGEWCVLRRHNIFEPPACFEFFACDARQDRERCVGEPLCAVGPLGMREGWEVEPAAHPPDNPLPYGTWEGVDYVMTVLDRYGGDWYGCLGAPTMGMPRRPAVRVGPSQPGFCILRKPLLFAPPNCFEFYLAAAGGRMALIQGGVCFLTPLAARQGWMVDPALGGPFLGRAEAQAAHDRLNRFAGDFYGCLAQAPGPFEPRGDPGRGPSPGPGPGPGPGAAPPGQPPPGKVCRSRDGRDELCRQHGCSIPPRTERVCMSRSGRNRTCQANNCQPASDCYWEETVIPGVPCYWADQ